jgi:hypothetical protein
VWRNKQTKIKLSLYTKHERAKERSAPNHEINRARKSNLEKNVGRRERNHRYIRSRKGKGRGRVITSSIDVQAISTANTKA